MTKIHKLRRTIAAIDLNTIHIQMNKYTRTMCKKAHKHIDDVLYTTHCKSVCTSHPTALLWSYWCDRDKESSRIWSEERVSSNAPLSLCKQNRSSYIIY